MTSPKIPPPLSKFRQQAEQIAQQQAPAMPENRQDLSPAEMRQMLHDLRVRQIELELEGEERERNRTSLFNTLLGSVPDLIFFKSLEGVYLECNPAFAATLGRSCEEIVGMTDYDLYPEEKATLFRSRDWEVLQSGNTRRSEECLTYPDGRKLILDTLKTGIKGPNDQMIGFLGVGRDISDRVRAEAAMSESEANFRAFFETIADMIFVVKPDGYVIFTNSAVTRKLGYSVEELKGKHLLDLHPAEVRAEAEVLFAAMVKGEGDFCPLALQAKDGSQLPVENRVWLGKWNGEECIFGVSKDLSAEREAVQRFESIFRNNPALIALVEFPSEQFMDVNESFLAGLGYSRSEIVGKTPHDISLFVNQAQHAAGFARVQKTWRFSDLEMQIRCKDGTVLDCLCSGERLLMQSRQFLVVVMIDVTQRKRVERELALERERLAGFVIGTNAGTWEWNIQTGATVFNERWAEMLGYTLAELAPISIDTWMRLTHPEDLPLAQQALELHFNQQCEQYEVEHRMRHKKGEWVWVLDIGRIVSRTPLGLPVLMLGAHLDITPRKRMEAELARISDIQRNLMHLATAFVNIPTEKQDEAISESLATIGGLIRADRAYLFLNDLAARTSSNTHEWCAEGILPEIDNLQNVPFEAFSDWLEVHERGELVSIPCVEALPESSQTRQILEPQGIRSLVSLPLVENGIYLGFVGFDAVREQRIWRDEEISLLRVLAELFAHFQARLAAEQATMELQQRLIIARDEAQAAAEAKSLFLANMSHEIRTPLNAILGYAQILEHDNQDSANGEHLRAITRSGEHLLTLINDLLELVRSDARTIQTTSADFDFYLMFEDVRLMFAGRLGAADVTVEVSLSDDLPQFIHGDQGMIRQILVNLVGNALKFTKQGWIRIRAALLSSDPPDHLVLEVQVEDTGCGIAPHEIERIFDAFEQSASGRRSGKGTGLGLFLSQRYAQTLGGDITVTSQPGQGSCFRVVFQARSCRGDFQSKKRSGEFRKLARHHLPCHALIVDDDAANREMLTMMLKRADFTVEVASDALSALHRLEQDDQVKLVLMDKRMPDMDGYEAIKRLREMPFGKSVAVVVVTASGYAEERELAIAAGADGYVAKPIRSGVLMEEISRVFGGSSQVVAAAKPVSMEQMAAVLTEISTELRTRLEAAVTRGNIRSLREALDEVGHSHPYLAAEMRVLADAYDYEHILRLLAAAKNQQPERSHE